MASPFVPARARLMDMAATFSELKKWIHASSGVAPGVRRWHRSLVILVFIGAVVCVIPRTPLAGPVGGVVGFSTVLAGCWAAGPFVGLITPLYIATLSRLVSNPPKPLVPDSQELTGLFVMTVLTLLMGITGENRRRLKTVTRRSSARLLQQSHALSLARILFRDLDGSITTWTQGAEDLFGWTQSEATGRRIQDLLKTEYPRPLEEIHQELLLHRQWQGEVRQHCKDGRVRIIATHWILYSGDDAVQGGVAEVHNDITLLREAEATLRESEHRKDLFVATLAYELRNPLAPLRSGLDCLQLLRGERPEDARVFEIMNRQLQHLVRLIDDLLDVSRINTGKVELRPERVSLNEIISDAISSCRAQIDAAGHELRLSMPNETICLNADPGRLTQVFTNLLHNAAKFTGAKGRIGLTVVSSWNEILIRVEDSGIGISKQMLPRVFDMFAQVQDVRTRGQFGLGLGLNIVKSLVEMHGGSVEVDSDGPGQGARFSVRLPRTSDDLPVAAMSLPSTPAANHLESRRVLVIDDNQDAACTLAMSLNIFGCVCRTAFDGVSGLQVAREFNPHVFVLDLGMPGMSGLDLARQLRAAPQFASAILIAVTGWDKEEDVQESRVAGFNYHFAKPVDVKALHRLIECNDTNQTS